MNAFGRLVFGSGILASMFVASVSAHAQSGADFFNGKTINYIVASDAGGGYDTNGRLIAEFMQKHLPGSTVVVRNMPGAGHVIGANYIYASEPDGLTIGTFNTGLIYQQLAGNQEIKFKLTDMSWVGKFSSEPRVIVVSTQSGIDSFEDLVSSQERIKFATCGVGCASMVEAKMLINTLDLPIDLISGYDGSEDQLAIRRGEVMGVIGSRSSFEQFVAEGHGKFIAQIGGSQDDVPQLGTLVTSESGLKTVALVAGQGTLSRFTAGPPGIPGDRLEALRAAYQAAVTDPELLERATAMKLPVDPMLGDDVRDAVAKALDQPEETIAFLKDNI
jgi:tripartite-type tricarboxylate transporter receptor subunit TctC